DNLSMTIPAGSIAGLVGASGAGKSTLIDVVLGLLDPQQGHIRVDGEVLGHEQQRIWRRAVGFVPQGIYLTDSSIAENVAFDDPGIEVDLSRVESAIQLACLEEMVADLPDGLMTKVGERGIQLSGGQRQRIGI